MDTKCESKSVDLGLLILRIGIGVAFIFHGYPLLMGGTEKWVGLGSAMAIFGITFAPAFWGFMAAFSEAVGGLVLIIGCRCSFRVAAFLLLITMIVATAMHINKGDEFKIYSHALKMAIVFLSLLIAGGGKYAFGCCCKKETEEKSDK